MATQLSNPQLLSGARGLISLAASDGTNRTLAIILDVTVTVRAGVRDTFVMGALNALSLDPTAIDVDVTLGRCIPVNASGTLSTPPSGGTLSGGASPGGSQSNVTASGDGVTAIDLGLEELILSTLSTNAVDITLTDSITGLVISSVRQCRFTGRTLSLNAGDVANERLNFTGIYDSGTAANPNAPGSLAASAPGSTADRGLGYGF
jgi:hypothetical protein